MGGLRVDRKAGLGEITAGRKTNCGNFRIDRVTSFGNRSTGRRGNLGNSQVDRWPGVGGFRVNFYSGGKKGEKRKNVKKIQRVFCESSQICQDIIGYGCIILNVSFKFIHPGFVNSMFSF